MAEILTFNEQGGNILTEYLFQIPKTILAWMWCNMKKMKRNNDIKHKAMLQSYVAKIHNVRIIPNDNSLRLFQQNVSAKSFYQNHCL